MEREWYGLREGANEIGVCDKHMEVMKKAMEYMKKEWETPLLQHVSQRGVCDA